jgi:apolipoprotein N-acyltransferase
MGIRFSSIILGAILAGIGLFWVLGTTIAAFGFLQTFACIVLTIALGLFYLIGYSDGKNAHYLNAKPGDTSLYQAPQRCAPKS